jgi:hypothetical protein
MQSQPLREVYEKVARLAPGVRPEVPLRASDRPAGSKAGHIASDRPSIGGRMFRAFARFCIAVLIGVSATLAWQLHGDEAEKFVSTWLPSLNRFLPIATLAQNTTFGQPASTARVSAPAAAVTPSEVTQRLETMASDIVGVQRNLAQLADISHDLADVRRSLEQLAARQEQIAQSIATLQKFEQDVKQRLASAPQSGSVPLPRRKPPPPAADSPAAQASSVPGTAPSTQQPLPLR